MKKLYSGFDLCAPTTSVSMTINGPAPMILAMFMNTAIDQRVERYLRAERPLAGGAAQDRELLGKAASAPPGYQRRAADRTRRLRPRAARRDGRSARRSPRPTRRIRAEALSQVRGTVQADILKEDQAQNTCIFSTEFALRMMGDVQQYFIDHGVRNFYSVSISGYHIAEAGANPISQLAFTLANGFTIVEYYLARGMKIDDFAPNLSFFFSNGMDPEYAVIGRVARRIWARAMRDLYTARAAQPDAEVPHPDVGPHAARARDPVQRHPHDAAGAVRAVRQLQQPAHQRLRRGAHDADRGKRAARGGDPAHHQPRARAQQEPEPVAGLVRSSSSSPTWSRRRSTRSSSRISERGGVLGAMETMYQRGKIQEECAVLRDTRSTTARCRSSASTRSCATAMPSEEHQGRRS